jgi:hypothetical protein
MSNERAPNSEKPNEEHLAWAIEQRAEVQHTLLAVYGFVRHSCPPTLDQDTRYLLDLLIGAAFSLWRAVFLAAEFHKPGHCERDPREPLFCRLCRRFLKVGLATICKNCAFRRYGFSKAQSRPFSSLIPRRNLTVSCATPPVHSRLIAARRRNRG